ncbi:MAG: type II methionyl aminopeptidase [Promethearchaeati archaeon SRVP18_Atabeyarchaeia-1]
MSSNDKNSKQVAKAKATKEPTDESQKKEEILGKYKKAAAIAKEVREAAKPIVKVAIPLIDLAEKIETLILEKGGNWAFPCGISINNLAAHYSPPPGDKSMIGEKDVVKVDFGVHIDGYIADTAFTVSFDPAYQKLVEAAEKGVKVAIENLKAGVETRRVGALVEVAIREMGYKPVKELTGHLLEQYEVHGPKIIPSVGSAGSSKLEEGEFYAVETFATNGSGSIHETPYSYIYRLMPVRTPVRFGGSRQILSIANKKYKTLPFAERWIAKEASTVPLKFALKELIGSGALYEYHVLADRKDSMIAQAEQTVLITKDGCEVLTS